MKGSLKATLDCATAFPDRFPRRPGRDQSSGLNHPRRRRSDATDQSQRRTNREAAPARQVHTYEGAPHGLFVTEKDRLSAAFIEFVG